jgi:ATP-dependent DNA helicase RecQ
MEHDYNEILKRYFGYESFREGQEELIRTILSGRDALGIMPTGAGKSICYQTPAMLMEGTTIVISPLISLITDQVQSLALTGIAAGCLHSGMDAELQEDMILRAVSGECQILYIAPERLDNEIFLRAVRRMNIAMVTVDEAHCVSQWGQDFRPSYLKIAEFVEGLPSRPVVSAFTATATQKVRDDIVHYLRLKNPYICVTGFNRENLFFRVLKPVDKSRELINLIGERSHSSGIIYCATRKTVEDVCEKLANLGFQATRYHAGLGDAERQRNQEDFQHDRKMVMVATNAFGMGIDKSNVRYVIHYNMPKSVEHYYQEAGRAGRDGEPADCIMLYGARDVRTAQFLIEKSAEGSENLTEEMRAALIEKDLQLLRRMTFYAHTTECLRAYLLKYFGEQADIYCGNCGNCLTEFDEIDVTIDAQKVVSCVYRINARGWPFGKAMIADVLRGLVNERVRTSGLDRIKTHGAMTGVPKRRITDLIDHLAREEYLSVSDERYPVVTLGNRWEEIVKDGAPVIMKMPKRSAESEHAEGAGRVGRSGRAYSPVAARTASDAPYSAELFEALRELRMELANAADIPAFVVFSDATLRDMCRKMPQTEEAFLSVSGVGEKKLAAYGKQFIGAVQAFAERVE